MHYITQQGWTDTATWLIILQEDFEIMKQAAFTPEVIGKDAQRYSDAFLTFRHETMHFWQAISTSFLYSYSCNYVNFCIDALNAVRHGGKGYTDIPFTEFQSKFNQLTEILLSPSQAIRTIDVIEGCAVFCAYRMNFPHASHEGFLRHLDERHSGQKEYRNAYLIATKMLGESAFELFAPACYIALQGDNPGRNLETIFLYAKDGLQFASHYDIFDDPLTFLLEEAHMQEEGCFPFTVARSLPQFTQGYFSHPILQPYIERIAQTTNLRLSDIFARPYLYENNSQDEISSFLSDMYPPVHVYSGRTALLMGLGQQLGKDYSIIIHHLTAIVGLASRLVFDTRSQMLCPHHNCPIYKTSLCQGYLAFPLDDYEKCKFPELLEGIELGKLLQ
jgi:hypothetical protein